MAEKSLSVEMTDPAPPPSWRTKEKKLSNTQILWNPFSLHIKYIVTWGVGGKVNKSNFQNMSENLLYMWD